MTGIKGDIGDSFSFQLIFATIKLLFCVCRTAKPHRHDVSLTTVDDTRTASTISRL